MYLYKMPFRSKKTQRKGKSGKAKTRRHGKRSYKRFTISNGKKKMTRVYKKRKNTFKMKKRMKGGFLCSIAPETCKLSDTLGYQVVDTTDRFFGNERSANPDPTKGHFMQQL